MIKKIIPQAMWLFIAILPSVQAQDDLLELLDKESEDPKQVNYSYATFKSTRLINGQSVETTAGGVLNFVIGHRFGKINDGWYEFWGLDNATIRLGFEYGITDNINIGIGRSSFMKTYDANIKWKFARQSSGYRNFPFTATWYSSMAINGLKWEDPERENYFSSRLSFSHQVFLARKFSNAFSLQLMPSYVHRNLVETKEDQNDVFALGIGGRIKITQRLSINGEYYYQFPGTNADKYNNSVALGLDIETGGHVFQVHITNSKGMIEQYFIPMTTGKLLDGDIFFGFNVNRVFTIKKKKDD
jgi:hypothetical protein